MGINWGRRTLATAGAGVWLLIMAAAPAGAVADAVPNAAQAAPRSAGSSDAHVSMKEFAYSPVTIHVPAGATVTWTYDESATDPVPNCESPYLQLPIPVSCPGHSVTSGTTVNGKPLFNSGVHRAAGFPYRVQFSTPGTYPYYCLVHGGPHPNNPATHMNGTVIVDPAPGAAAAVSGSAATVTATEAASSPASVAGQSQSRAIGAATLAATGPSGPMGWRAAAVAAALAGLGLSMARRRWAG